MGSDELWDAVCRPRRFVRSAAGPAGKQERLAGKQLGWQRSGRFGRKAGGSAGKQLGWQGRGKVGTMAEEKKKSAIQDGYAAEFRFLVMTGQAPSSREGVAENQRLRFSKVSGLESTMEYEELAEGGKNDAPHILTAPHKKHAPLVLEHGLVPAESRFAKWKPGMRLGTWLTVILLDAKGQLTPGKFWITDGIVTKREIGNLDAMSNSILIERFEIMHDGILYTG